MSWASVTGGAPSARRRGPGGRAGAVRARRRRPVRAASRRRPGAARSAGPRTTTGRRSPTPTKSSTRPRPLGERSSNAENRTQAQPDGAHQHALAQVRPRGALAQLAHLVDRRGRGGAGRRAAVGASCAGIVPDATASMASAGATTPFSASFSMRLVLHPRLAHPVGEDQRDREHRRQEDHGDDEDDHRRQRRLVVHEVADRVVLAVRPMPATVTSCWPFLTVIVRSPVTDPASSVTVRRRPSRRARRRRRRAPRRRVDREAGRGRRPGRRRRRLVAGAGSEAPAGRAARARPPQRRPPAWHPARRLRESWVPPDGERRG